MISLKNSYARIRSKNKDRTLALYNFIYFFNFIYLFIFIASENHINPDENFRTEKLYDFFTRS